MVVYPIPECNQYGGATDPVNDATGGNLVKSAANYWRTENIKRAIYEYRSLYFLSIIAS